MRALRFVLFACAALTLAGAASAAPRHRAANIWVGSWATSQQIPEPENALAPEDLQDATLRQIVHLSIGGRRLRVRLSNAFGTAPLHISAAHIARAAALGTAAIAPGSDRALLFSGAPDVTIPAGAEYISDPIDFDAPALSDIALTLRFDATPPQQTSHPGSRTTSFYVHGDHVADTDLANAKTATHWYQIAGIDVLAPAGASAVVTLGDSITDGRGSTTDHNDRWPDAFARRLQAFPPTRHIGVLNAGIGGGRVLADGKGQSALARFDRDVLAPAGVRYLIVFEGINDIGTLTVDHEASPEAHAALVARLIAAYEQIIARAHARGVRVYGATITPFTGSGYYHPGPASEADRQAVNAWIRTPGHFDAVIDFDAATRDPASPARLASRYDSGDQLHLSPAGYRAMAAAIPLRLFRR